MDKTEKLLRKAPKKDRIRIKLALEQLVQRDFARLLPEKLEGYDHIYRIRVGNYRLFYYDDGTRIIFKGVKRRNESTYKMF